MADRCSERVGTSCSEGLEAASDAGVPAIVGCAVKKSWSRVVSMGLEQVTSSWVQSVGNRFRSFPAVPSSNPISGLGNLVKETEGRRGADEFGTMSWVQSVLIAPWGSLLGWLALQTGRKIGYWKPRCPDCLGMSDLESASRGQETYFLFLVPPCLSQGLRERKCCDGFWPHLKDGRHKLTWQLLNSRYKSRSGLLAHLRLCKPTW